MRWIQVKHYICRPNKKREFIEKWFIKHRLSDR
jgi:hypothetical protein